METIDDDCSNRDISFVKTAEKEAIEVYGIAKLPSLVFFKQDIPNLYEGEWNSHGTKPASLNSNPTFPFTLNPLRVPLH